MTTFAEWTTVQGGFPGNLSPIAPTLGLCQWRARWFPEDDSYPHNGRPELDVPIVPGIETAVPFPDQDQLVNFTEHTHPKVKNIIGVGTGSGLFGKL